METNRKASATTSTRPEPLWGPAEVAAYLGVPVQTLYQWRRKRTGPPGRRVGRHLRYDPADVHAWFVSLSEVA